MSNLIYPRWKGQWTIMYLFQKYKFKDTDSIENHESVKYENIPSKYLILIL